jgi:3'-phosphoadenosine 5'-phosphosulfate sulfotransferase (PAPS reductase)/FAD synthetase
MSAFQYDLVHSLDGGSLGAGWYVVANSGGNDSIALIQWFYENGFKNVLCLYNDTGWSMPAVGNQESWHDRMLKVEALCESYGFRHARTTSMGFEALVKFKKAFPRQGIQFCTEILKMLPTIAFLAEHDPTGEAICANGKRRHESEQRANTVEWIYKSDAHGGRDLRQPLWDTTTEERDALILRAGFEILPHKSKECKLCVNENREGLLMTPDVVIQDVARLEGEMGITGNGKPRTFFRPASKMGATGIHEVVRWSKAQRGKYRSLSDSTGKSQTESGCDGGYCAS